MQVKNVVLKMFDSLNFYYCPYVISPRISFVWTCTYRNKCSFMIDILNKVLTWPKILINTWISIIIFTEIYRDYNIVLIWWWQSGYCVYINYI